MQGGADIAQRPELYRPLEEAVERMKAKALPLERLSTFNAPDQVAEVLAAWPQASSWMPLMARAQPMVVLMGPEPAQVLAVVALKPWE